MPYGVGGIVSGAAKCFFGFVGFDCLAATGEEAKNPKRNIPLAIILSFVIIFLTYFGVATVLTMMWPYYDLVGSSENGDGLEFPKLIWQTHLTESIRFLGSKCSISKRIRKNWMDQN